MSHYNGEYNMKTNLQKFKRSTKRFEEFLHSKNHTIEHSTLLNGLSIFMGYKDWHTLKNTFDTNNPDFINKPKKSSLKIYIKRGVYNGEHLDKHIILDLIGKEFNSSDYLLFSDHPVNFINKNNLKFETFFGSEEKNIVFFNPNFSFLIKSFYSLKNKKVLIFLSDYSQLHKFHSLLTKKEKESIHEVAFLNTDEESVEEYLEQFNKS